MLESVVRRTWENIVSAPELFEISQPLEVRRVHDPADTAHTNENDEMNAMHRVNNQWASFSGLFRNT